MSKLSGIAKFFSAIANPLSILAAPITEHFKGKQALAKSKAESKQAIAGAKTKAKIDRIERASQSDISLDSTARQAAGVMDDISFYVFLSPAVLSFYPPALPHIKAGFMALESMPLWWQYSLGMMLISVWGYRRLVTPVVTAIAKAYIKRL